MMERTDASEAPEHSDTAPKAAGHKDPAKESEATRARLVEATIELLNRGGNHSLRLADVAKETGVAVSTIYAHFRDRTDLVAAARLAQFRAHADEALRAVDVALDHTTDQQSLAGLLLWPTLLAPDDEGSRTRRWDRIEAIADARHIPELAEQIEQLQSTFTRRATELTRRAQELELIDPDLDPAALALFTQVMRLGLTLWDLSGDARPTPEAWVKVIEHFAASIAVAPVPGLAGQPTDHDESDGDAPQPRS